MECVFAFKGTKVDWIMELGKTPKETIRMFGFSC